MYLIYKTFAIANSYPAYEEFSGLGELDKFTQEVEPETMELIYKLVKTIKRDKSHISLKIRQTIHFLNALKKGTIDSQKFLTRKISRREYFLCVDEGKDLRSMRDIQEYLPPSFFQIEILMNRFENGERVNDTPIPIEQMSAGERQYLYTFSTYIYHVLNLLSIQESHRVRYRNINLILDEVEICFHPEFQRRFVYELLGYIKRLFMNRNASFNILIATHSPFILSDIPQSNILYLEDGKMARTYELPEDEDMELWYKGYNLLTAKPTIYAANVAEDDLADDGANNPFVASVREKANEEGSEVFVVCAQIEEEISELDDDEKAMFLEDLGLKESGLDKLIKASYSLLGLISFLTAGEDECRAWTIKKGTKAPQAAGKIHTDFERGFIKAEVVNYEDLLECGSLSAAREKGIVGLEGKDYVVKDGDVILFRFNV